MPTINVSGREVDVDIRTELEQYDWHNARWSEDKLIAGSPFRYDRTPSWYVSLDHGGWRDAGAYDSEWESGGFPKLLSFLREETYEETVEYLLATYAPFYAEKGADNADVKLPGLRLQEPRTRTVLPEKELALVNRGGTESDYLTSQRGITPQVQRYLETGYSKVNDAITLPWRHADGSLANIKFRKTRGKVFWYRKGGEHIRNLVYASHIVFQRELPAVYICEAEIDALSVMSAGKPAVALGGASVSRRQMEILRKAPTIGWIIATDNDKAGEKLREQLAEGLAGYGRLGDVRVPAPYKDANEALLAGVELAELPVSWRSGLRMGRSRS